MCSRICFFSPFIYELSNEIVERGRHGIQLTPDLVESFSRLLADVGILAYILCVIVWGRDSLMVRALDL